MVSDEEAEERWQRERCCWRDEAKEWRLTLGVEGKKEARNYKT